MARLHSCRSGDLLEARRVEPLEEGEVVVPELVELGNVRAEAEARNARSRVRRVIEKEAKRPAQKIHEHETKIEELTAELEKPETYDDSNRAVARHRDVVLAQTTHDCLTDQRKEAAKRVDSV